ncbi:hypothetical protein [Marinilabilia sp.]
MNLTKKVIFGMVAGLFAVATVFNMSMLNDNGAGDVSLDAIAVMAHADGESGSGCTATANCYDRSRGNILTGTISCSGDECSVDYEEVTCDGVTHSCDG